MKKIQLKDIAPYMYRYVYEKVEEGKIASWFNKKNLKISSYHQLEQEYGAYNIDIFKENNWIPIESVDILRLEKEFINKHGGSELIDSVKDLGGEELQRAFNVIIHDYEYIAEKWFETHRRVIDNKAVEWLKKNNIPYRIDRESKAFVDL